MTLSQRQHTEVDRPLVSIAIPTYNRAGAYLPETLDSALSQTYPHLEIVVSDNCSSDDTEGLVTGIGDPRIRYFRHADNIGATKNFAFCLEQARGKYFLLLHDDDLIDADFVETCVDAVPTGVEVGVILAGIRVIDGHKRVKYEVSNRCSGLTTEEFFLGWLGGMVTPHLCSTLFDTARLREIGGLQSRHHHLDDAMAVAELAGRFGRADVAPVKSTFRSHEGKRGNLRLVSPVDVRDWCEDALLLLDRMCGFCDNKRAVRKKGMRSYSSLCYRRATVLGSVRKRWAAYWIVFRMFGYRHPPPWMFRWARRISPIRLVRRAASTVKRRILETANQ